MLVQNNSQLNLEVVAKELYVVSAGLEIVRSEVGGGFKRNCKLTQQRIMVVPTDVWGFYNYI